MIIPGTPPGTDTTRGARIAERGVRVRRNGREQHGGVPVGHRASIGRMRIGAQDVDIEAPSSPRRVDWTHEPAAEVAGVVRRRLREVLARWGVPEDVVDDAMLVVTELVANVVDHAMTSFRLVVHLTGSVLRIAVADGSPELPVLRPFDPQARRGRGLQVIGSVARKWGCDQHEGGKVVWAELAV